MKHDNRKLIPAEELAQLMRDAWARGEGARTAEYAEALRNRGWNADITVETLEVVVTPRWEGAY